MSPTDDRATATRLPAGRRAVLYAVRRRGEATAEQVAEQLDITVSGARQHLERAGDATVWSRRASCRPPTTKRGRRTLVYAATGAADAYFPKAYGELTNELLGYVADTDRELLDELFAKRREARIAGARVRLATKRTLGAKVAELTRILDEDGYLASWEKVGAGRLPDRRAQLRDLGGRRALRPGVHERARVHPHRARAAPTSSACSTWWPAQRRCAYEVRAR